MLESKMLFSEIVKITFTAQEKTPILFTT